MASSPQVPLTSSLWSRLSPHLTAITMGLAAVLRSPGSLGSPVSSPPAGLSSPDLTRCVRPGVGTPSSPLSHSSLSGTYSFQMFECALHSVLGTHFQDAPHLSVGRVRRVLHPLPLEVSRPQAEVLPTRAPTPATCTSIHTSQSEAGHVGHRAMPTAPPAPGRATGAAPQTAALCRRRAQGRLWAAADVPSEALSLTLVAQATCADLSARFGSRPACSDSDWDTQSAHVHTHPLEPPFPGTHVAPALHRNGAPLLGTCHVPAPKPSVTNSFYASSSDGKRAGSTQAPRFPPSTPHMQGVLHAASTCTC